GDCLKFVVRRISGGVNAQLQRPGNDGGVVRREAPQRSARSRGAPLLQEPGRRRAVAPGPLCERAQKGRPSLGPDQPLLSAPRPAQTLCVNHRGRPLARGDLRPRTSRDRSHGSAQSRRLPTGVPPPSRAAPMRALPGLEQSGSSTASRAKPLRPRLPSLLPRPASRPARSLRGARGSAKAPAPRSMPAARNLTKGLILGLRESAPPPARRQTG